MARNVKNSACDFFSHSGNFDAISYKKMQEYREIAPENDPCLIRESGRFCKFMFLKIKETAIAICFQNFSKFPDFYQFFFPNFPWPGNITFSDLFPWPWQPWAILLLFHLIWRLVYLTPCMLGNFACFFVVCGFFFKINFFKINLAGIPSECQTVWIKIRPDILSRLIWIQTVCKGYQQMTKVATSGEISLPPIW